MVELVLPVSKKFKNQITTPINKYIPKTFSSEPKLPGSYYS